MFIVTEKIKYIFHIFFSASNTFNDETEIDSKYEDSDKESDSDSIDETSLKDAEMNLTEDEKAERQVIAEELKRAGNEAFKVGDFDRSIEKYTEGNFKPTHTLPK